MLRLLQHRPCLLQHRRLGVGAQQFLGHARHAQQADQAHIGQQQANQVGAQQRLQQRYPQIQPGAQGHHPQSSLLERQGEAVAPQPFR